MLATTRARRATSHDESITVEKRTMADQPDVVRSLKIYFPSVSKKSLQLIEQVGLTPIFPFEGHWSSAATLEGSYFLFEVVIWLYCTVFR